MLLRGFKKLSNWVKKLPIIRRIPGFNSLPPGITSSNLRFYMLSNLVLTLGMFIHGSWISLFFLLDIPELMLINIGSVAIYIFCIVINRKGYHFTSSVIMVVEILVHQLIAVQVLGWEAGFQNYLIVIGLFPFLMPRGRWFIKSVLLLVCICTYIILEYLAPQLNSRYPIPSGYMNYMKVSNSLFSYASMAICGGYFNIAVHETERRLKRRTEQLRVEKDKTENLLLNILPEETAQELKETGKASPRAYSQVTVIFTDFKNFTQFSEKLPATELVDEINYYYSAFDDIVTRNRIEKIKTIGDGYLCVGGIPSENQTNPVDAVKAAIELLNFVEDEKKRRQSENQLYFDIRIGIHTGPVVAGIVGIKKFAYDIWGDTVNTASRMESSGEAGYINISEATYHQIKHLYECEYRGEIEAKNKGKIGMYFVKGSVSETPLEAEGN